MPGIIEVYAREVLDSRGNPTVEVEVTTESGAFGRAIVPAGDAAEEREAVELRDADRQRYMGKGVLKAIENINDSLSAAVMGMDVTEQVAIDRVLTETAGTESKNRLGGNATLGVSLACARAAADYYKMPLYRYLGGANAKLLPVPMMCMICGGKHANSSVDFQEYMIMPVGAPSFKEGVRWCSEIFHYLGKVLTAKGYSTAVGDEGGYAPNLKGGNEEPLKLIMEAIDMAHYEPYRDIAICLDIAANEFYNNEINRYQLVRSGKGTHSTDAMIQLYEDWLLKYPIVSIEDGLSEKDWDGWKKMTDRLGKQIQLVGDDLFVTNTAYLKKGIEEGVANSILIKPGQIGTLTEAMDAMELARNYKYTAIVSQRLADSEDTTIADLVVGMNAGQIKTGSMSRSDRVAKYNQLLRIEDELGDSAVYLGKDAFYNVKIH